MGSDTFRHISRDATRPARRTAAVALAVLSILIAGSVAVVPQLARAQLLTPALTAEGAPFDAAPAVALLPRRRTVEPPATPVASDVVPAVADAAPARIEVRARRGIDASVEESAPRIMSATPVATEPSVVTEVLAAAPAPSTAPPVAAASAPQPPAPVASAPVVAVAAAPAPAAPPPAAAAVLVLPQLSAREAGLLEAMNVARLAAGLEPLEIKASLTEVARARSRDMTENSYFAHFHPNGISAYELLSAARITFSAGGENLAKVGGDVEHSVRSAIDALLRSPTHRDNILNPRYRFFGVGSVTSDAGVTILTSIFTDR